MPDQSDSDFVSSNKIEKAGQDILQSLQKAADVAEASRETARRLSHQLQNAENRIAELENRIRELEAEVQLSKRKWSVQNSGSAHFSLRLRNACLGNGKRGGKKAETAAVQRY